MTLQPELEMESAATELEYELESAALEVGGRCPPDSPFIVRGFRRYSNAVALLPRAEQEKVNNIAREIVQASSAGATPVVQVRLLGHADYDPVRERAQPGFMRQISRQRAEALLIFLRNRVGVRIASTISWNQDGVGADQLAVPGPQTERERECNRRVEVQLVRRNTPPPSPPTALRSIKLTVKSFIARIGNRHGTATCFLPLLLPPPAPPIPIGADLRLRALAAATDSAFSENPLTDRPDRGYRLFSECTFQVVCTPGGPPVVRASVLATDVGLECLPHLRACLVPPPITVIQPVTVRSFGPNTFQFAWAVKGRPNLAAEPTFQAVCPRTSVFIWHRIVGNVVCDAGGLRLGSFSLTGSRFPSHRLFVNGANCGGCTVPQNEFRNLWIRDASDPTLVTG